MTEKNVVVRWTDCECQWASKVCDEIHTRAERIPLSKILEWVGDKSS